MTGNSIGFVKKFLVRTTVSSQRLFDSSVTIRQLSHVALIVILNDPTFFVLSILMDLS